MKEIILYLKVLLSLGANNFNTSNKHINKRKTSSLVSTILGFVFLSIEFTFFAVVMCFSYISLKNSVGVSSEQIQLSASNSLNLVNTFFFIGAIFFNTAIGFTFYYPSGRENINHMPIEGKKIFKPVFLLFIFLNLVVSSPIIFTNLITFATLFSYSFISIFLGIVYGISILVIIPLLSFLLVYLFSKFIRLGLEKVKSLVLNFSFILLVAFFLIITFLGFQTLSKIGPNAEENSSFLPFINFLINLSLPISELIYFENKVSILFIIINFSLAIILGYLTYWIVKNKYLKSYQLTNKNKNNKLKKEKHKKDKKVVDIQLKLHKELEKARKPFLVLVKRDFRNLIKMFPKLVIYISFLIITYLIMFSVIPVFQENLILRNYVTLFYLLFALFPITTPVISFCAISNEKKSFSYLKVMPINRLHYLISKMIPSLFIMTPVIFIIHIISSVTFSISILDSIFIFIYLVVYFLLTNLYLTMMSFLYPYFNEIAETSFLASFKFSLFSIGCYLSTYVLLIIQLPLISLALFFNLPFIILISLNIILDTSIMVPFYFAARKSLDKVFKKEFNI